MRKIVLISFFILLGHLGLAQDCSNLLEQANVAYQSGQFEKSLQILNPCIGSESESEQFSSYRLKCLNYLALENEAKAREAAIAMLRLNPEYQSDLLNDPATFTRLLNGITIIPKFSLGLGFSLGTNRVFPRVAKVFSPVDNTKTYTGLNSFQFAIATTYQLNKRLAIQLQLQTLSKRYEIDYSIEGWDHFTEEQLQYFQVPLRLRYQPVDLGRWHPYISAGIYGSGLLNARQSFRSEHLESGSIFTLDNIPSSERRSGLEYGYDLGAGVLFDLGKGRIFASLQYQSAINLTNEPETRYSFEKTHYDYRYLDDDFRLDNLAFSFGYSLFLNYQVLDD